MPISWLFGSYWTVRSSCGQRGPAFGLLLPSHISSCTQKSAWLALTLLNSPKANKTTGPHLLRRISNRYRSTLSILYYCKRCKGKENQTCCFFIPLNIFISLLLFKSLLFYFPVSRFHVLSFLLPVLFGSSPARFLFKLVLIEYDPNLPFLYFSST